MKALCLILDSEPPEEAWRETYSEHRRAWRQALNSCPWIDGYFIRSTPHVVDPRSYGPPGELWRHFEVPGEEQWGTVFDKTKCAIRLLLNNHDYVIRTNLSSLYDLPLFEREPIKSDVYSGALVEDAYVTGSGILMSNDVAQKLTLPYDRGLPNWDDMAIGVVLSSHGIKPERRDMLIYDFDKGIEQIELGAHIHYRFRDYSDPTRARERKAKSELFDKIFDKGRVL